MDGTLVDWLTAPEKVNLRSRIFAPPPSLARGLVQFCGRRYQRCPRPRHAASTETVTVNLHRCRR